MSEILNTAYEEISDELSYLGAVKRLYANAIENGKLLAGTRFSDETLADQSAESYVSSLRQAISRIENFDRIAVYMLGKGMTIVEPEVDTYSDDNGKAVTTVEINYRDASHESEFNDISGSFQEVYVRARQQGFGLQRIPYMVARNLSNRKGVTINDDNGIPLIAQHIETFASIPLDGSVDITVPRFEVLNKYQRALGILAENATKYPWFTDTAAHLIKDLSEMEPSAAGSRLRQLGGALDRLDDDVVYRQGVEALSGIIGGNNVIVYGSVLQGDGMPRNTIASGVIDDIESNRDLDPMSIVVKTNDNGEGSVYRFPIHSVTSIQRIN